MNERFQKVDRRFDKQESEIQDIKAQLGNATAITRKTAASVESISLSIPSTPSSLLVTLLSLCGPLILKCPNISKLHLDSVLSVAVQGIRSSILLCYLGAYGVSKAMGKSYG